MENFCIMSMHIMDKAMHIEQLQQKITLRVRRNRISSEDHICYGTVELGMGGIYKPFALSWGIEEFAGEDGCYIPAGNYALQHARPDGCFKICSVAGRKTKDGNGTSYIGTSMPEVESGGIFVSPSARDFSQILEHLWEYLIPGDRVPRLIIGDRTSDYYDPY